MAEPLPRPNATLTSPTAFVSEGTRSTEGDKKASSETVVESALPPGELSEKVRRVQQKTEKSANEGKKEEQAHVDGKIRERW